MRTVDPRAAFVTVASGTMLVSAPEAGVTAYDPRGNRLFRSLVGKEVWLQASGQYAYASVWERRRRTHRTFVLRLSGGRIVNAVVADQPPTLLASYEASR
jgi:hypothetical protein